MKYCILLLFLFLCVCEAKDVVYTKRENNYLREGPASFYPLVEIVPRGTKLTVEEKQENWLRVILEDKRTGWIGKNSLTDSPGQADARKAKWLNILTSSKANKSGVSAAVKGLNREVTVGAEGPIDSFLKLVDRNMNYGDFRDFTAKIAPVRSKNAGKLTMDKLGLDTPEYDPGLDEFAIGTVAAGRIWSKGGVMDAEVTKYLNFIAQTLAASSEYYEWHFRVGVLNDDKIDGFACPGGFIFLTRGAVLACDDEAELAAMIAHEMGHIIRRHGLQEMTNRAVSISGEDSFNELSKETGDAADSTETELNEFAEIAFDRIVHERLLAYEMESDKVAAVLCANAGYDPYAIGRVTNKLARLYHYEQDIFSYRYASPDDARTRMVAIQKLILRECISELLQGQLSARLAPIKAKLAN